MMPSQNPLVQSMSLPSEDLKKAPKYLLKNKLTANSLDQSPYPSLPRYTINTPLKLTKSDLK